jgi:hypothetical protein
MFDLAKFTLKEMTDLGRVLRKLGDGAVTMEEVAHRVVSYLFDHAFDPSTGKRNCVLVRFFKTHSFGTLEPELQQFAKARMPGHEPTPSMKCLTLLASRGERAAWNDRKRSATHQAIPLPSAEMVSQAPMISNLLSQLGVETAVLLDTEAPILVESQPSSFNVFYVPEAMGSPQIPAQQEFAIPFGLKSVLGFGGMLPSGEIFAVILFSRVHIPRETADLFKTLALSVKVAVLSFEDKVFA